MDSIFSKIIRREIPSYTVAEDDKHYAFLDIRPLRKGHTLVVPKREVDHLIDLSEAEHSALWTFAQKIALSIRECMPCTRVASVVLGMEVPHAHIHLIPIDQESDIRFDRAPKAFAEEEMKVIASEISEGISL